MKCVICGERKGKRACPAKGGVICAQCCGEKRILEIDCPEACDYLKTGIQRDASRAVQWTGTAPDKLQKFRRVAAEHEDLIGRIEYAIASQRQSSRDLKDEHVAQALDLLLKTLRSEDSGVLYEQTSEHILVEGLRRRLRDVVQERRRPDDAAADPYALSPAAPGRLKLGAAIDVLEFVRELVRNYMNNARSRHGYAEHLVRTMMGGLSKRESAPSIIVPGR